VAFKDLAETIDVREPIRLPIMGQLVEFPGTISARAGMILLAIMGAAKDALAADADVETATAMASVSVPQSDSDYLEAQMLGDVADRLDELVEYNVRRRNLVTNTLLVWHSQGSEAAETYWNAGGDLGKALPNRETRRAAGRSSTTDGGQPARSKAQPRQARPAGGSSPRASQAKPRRKAV
jgi:hypothetical protein